jgi:hypothetical protein
MNRVAIVRSPPDLSYSPYSNSVGEKKTLTMTSGTWAGQLGDGVSFLLFGSTSTLIIDEIG